ncbi:hypothetical protein ACIRVF_03560 [Kitasatospora sp. NPDC101157]|uniref:hypothetical protein n=1 Tax=Kitasatospora sp. NPDC101157 TaxID=3364098 RepID=UPI003809CAD4
MVDPTFRDYRIPAYADVPRTDVLLVESADSLGPLRSKGMAESCINPVAPALANAVHDATGVRFRALPLTPERIYRRLAGIRPGVEAPSTSTGPATRQAGVTGGDRPA